MCFDLALLAATSLSVERDSVEVLELGRVLLDVNWSLRLNPNRGYLERFDEIKTHKKYDCLVLYNTIGRSATNLQMLKAVKFAYCYRCF